MTTNLLDPVVIKDSVKSLEEYWNKYSSQDGHETYYTHTLLEDALYAIGIALKPEEYKYVTGFRQFKKDLKEWLEKNEY